MFVPRRIRRFFTQTILMTPALYLLLGIALGAAAAFFVTRALFLRGRISPDDHEVLRRQCTDAQTEAALSAGRAHMLVQQLTEKDAAMQSTLVEKEAAVKYAATLEARLDAVSVRLDEQAAFVQSVKEEMQTAFGRLASQSLENNAERFGEAQRARLNDLLKPFREQIDGFRQDVSDKFIKEVADRNSLKGELAKMLELNQNLSQKTEALTTALSAQAREQGAFGEDILETILSNAGMVKGEHFHTQYAGQNEDGRAIRPDVILQCPDGRRIVVDSKVSLTAYIRYCNDCDSPDEQKTAAREVHQSFKNHIDGLSAKKYETLRDGSSEVADFVLMFTPVEGAFTVATMHDAELRHYAFRKKVFLVTPGNLLLVVKLITDLWQKDAVNRRAHDMAERALKLYDKARLFLESFEATGAALGKAQDAWEEAKTRLTGNGGLVRQGEMLGGLLGNRAKALPTSLSSEADPLQELLPEGTKLVE